MIATRLRDTEFRAKPRVIGEAIRIDGIDARIDEVAPERLDGLYRGREVIAVLPYTGMTPEMSSGMLRVARLLRAAAGAVFLIACAKVASFLLARASARAHETSVRVVLGARRTQIGRLIAADSIVIAAAGGALALVLAVWTVQIVPAPLFESDAGQLVFALRRSRRRYRRR